MSYIPNDTTVIQYDRGDLVRFADDTARTPVLYRVTGRQRLTGVAGGRYSYRIVSPTEGELAGVRDEDLVVALDVDTEFLAIVAASETPYMPRVVDVVDVDGVLVTIVEPVMPPDVDGVAERGYLWVAVTGAFKLTAGGYGVDGRRYPGHVSFGRILATSTRSAQAALAGARRKLDQA
jgi:hypothetical protein